MIEMLPQTLEKNTSENLDFESFRKMLNGYFALSFKYAQGSAPLQNLYNILFITWLQKQFSQEVLQSLSIEDLLDDVAMPKNHADVDEDAIQRGNKMAKLSLSTAYNVMIKGEENSFDMYQSDRDLRYSLDFERYNPNEALEILMTNGEDGVSDEILANIVSQDDKYILFRRPNAKRSMETASYFRNYILLADRENARHPYFNELFHKLKGTVRDGLAQQLFDEELEQSIYALADLWEADDEHTERFFPQEFFSEVLEVVV